MPRSEEDPSALNPVAAKKSQEHHLTLSTAEPKTVGVPIGSSAGTKSQRELQAIDKTSNSAHNRQCNNIRSPFF